MPERSLRGCRILVVEDEWFLADELRNELQDADATVVGPVATIDRAIALIRADPRIDGAVLDVNLNGTLAYAAADLLIERHVPFVFTTGYDASVIPPRFDHVKRCDKPVSLARITSAIGRAAGDDHS